MAERCTSLSRFSLTWTKACSNLLYRGSILYWHSKGNFGNIKTLFLDLTLKVAYVYFSSIFYVILRSLLLFFAFLVFLCFQYWIYDPKFTRAWLLCDGAITSVIAIRSSTAPRETGTGGDQMVCSTFKLTGGCDTRTVLGAVVCGYEVLHAHLGSRMVLSTPDGSIVD